MFPFGLAQFSWAHKQHRRKLERTEHWERAAKALERTQQLAYFGGLGDRGEVRCLCRWDCTNQIASWIGFAVAFLDPIAKDAADLATGTMRGISCAAAVNAFQYLQHFWSIDLCDRAPAEPGKHIMLEASEGLFVLCRLNVFLALPHPRERHYLKGIRSSQLGSALVSPLRLAWINAIRQLLSRRLAPFARLDKGDVRIYAKSKALLFSVKPVFQNPSLGARRQDQQEQTTTIKELLLLLRRLRVAYREVGESHTSSCH